MERGGERHVAEAKMMPVALAVGGRVHQPRLLEGRGLPGCVGVLHRRHQMGGVGEDAVEGDAFGNVSIVEEKVNQFAAFGGVSVGPTRGDGAVTAV